INDPKLAFYVFQKQSEGELDVRKAFVSGRDNGIAPNGKVIRSFRAINAGHKIIHIIKKDSYYIEGFSIYDENNHEAETYVWNNEKKDYFNGNLSLSESKTLEVTYNTSSESVTAVIYRYYGDNCIYDYAEIQYQPVTGIIQKLTESAWKTTFLFNAPESCRNTFVKDAIQRILEKDRTGCAYDEVQKDVTTLKNSQNLKEPLQVVNIVNNACLSALRNLNYEEIIAFFNVAASQESIKEESELALLRLMNALNEKDYSLFYQQLEADGNKLIKHLVNQMHDASAYFWTDKKNYTNFMGALATMFNTDKGASIKNRLPANDDDYVGRVINLSPTIYQKSTDVFQVTFSDRRNKAKYNDDTGAVSLIEVYTTTTYTMGERNADVDTKRKEDEIVIGELSPLTPVFLVLDNTPLPLVQTALDGATRLGNNVYVVPAVFLKYNADKIRNDYIEKGIYITLDLATIYASGGVALATKVTWVRRAWAMAEVAGAVGSIGVNTQTINPNSDLGKAVNAYNLGMGIIGVKNLAVGGYKFVSNLPQATKTLLQENKGLRNLLLSQYLDYRIAITKLQNSDEYANLTNEVRQQIIAEKKVFSELADAKNTAKWGAADEIFINGKTKDDILNIEKGKRPLPETYLSSNYIQQHLSTIEGDGIVSRIVLKNSYEKFGIGKPDKWKSEFILSKKDADILLSKDLDFISQSLGVPKDQLDGGLIRIDFKTSSKFKIHIPSGNEYGTNSLWLPGGKLPNGNLEAVIYTDGMVKDIDYIVIDTKTGNKL
ncbi:MAG: hypothetical protein Q4G63_12865, partial [Bacteroidia bacterium]|nr:hypothetical protein [Bacteroidia bacterium]